MDELVLAFIPRMIGKCRIRKALWTGRNKEKEATTHGYSVRSDGFFLFSAYLS